MKAKEIYQYVLAGVIVLAFFIVLILMIEKGTDANPVLNVMVGTLGTITVMVASYFFGSSKGSADKNDIIKNGK